MSGKDCEVERVELKICKEIWKAVMLAVELRINEWIILLKVETQKREWNSLKTSKPVRLEDEKDGVRDDSLGWVLVLLAKIEEDQIVM